MRKTLLLSVITAILVPATALAMPNWDGIYVCTTNGKDKKYIALKNADEKLHIIGFSTDLEKLNDGLDCANDTYAPNTNTVISGMAIESHCDDKSLSESISFSLGKVTILLKVAITQTSPNTVELSIKHYRQTESLKDSKEFVFHCEK